MRWAIEMLWVSFALALVGVGIAWIVTTFPLITLTAFLFFAVSQVGLWIWRRM